MRPSSHDVSIHPSRRELEHDNIQRSMIYDTTLWFSYPTSWVIYFYELEALYSILISRLTIIMTYDIINLVITLSLNHKMWRMPSHITMHYFEDFIHHAYWSCEFLLHILSAHSFAYLRRSEFHSQVQDAQVIRAFRLDFATTTLGDSVPFSPFYCF